MGLEECAAGVEAQMKIRLFPIGELDTGSQKRRHWNWVSKDLKKRAFQVEENQESSEFA